MPACAGTTSGRHVSEPNNLRVISSAFTFAQVTDDLSQTAVMSESPVKQTINPDVWRALATREGNEVVSASDF